MINKLFTLFIIFYFWLLFIIFFFLILFVFLITFPFDKYRKAPNFTLSIMARLILKASIFWKVEIEGIEKYNPEEPVIFVANHQSFLDMALIYHLPWKMKWVAKKSLTYIPIMGWMVWLTGHLTIDRTSRSSIKRLTNLVQPLKDRVPVMMFPEGTRTIDGTLKPFKNGAFLLAKQYGFKIQPMILDGTAKAMPPGFRALNPKAKMRLKILDAIDTTQFEKPTELRSHTYHLINEELNKIRNM